MMAAAMLPQAAHAQVNQTTTIESRPPALISDYPYEIPIEPPHTVHSVFANFDTYEKTGDSYRFMLPESPDPTGVYGAYWKNPLPPQGYNRLVGAKLYNFSWTGETTDVVIPFAIQTTNSGGGFGTGSTSSLVSYQCLPHTACAVYLPWSQSGDTTLMLDEPLAITSTNDAIIALDVENVDMGQGGSRYPSTVSFDKLEWIWESDDHNTVTTPTTGILPEVGKHYFELRLIILGVVLSSGLAVFQYKKNL